jgi:hypothetical protein
MSASEVMVREQLDRIIARTKLPSSSTAFMPAPSRPMETKRRARPTRTDASRSGETEDMSERILLPPTKGRRRTARSRARGMECATTRNREAPSESASA